jgi:hypothetical protein
MWREWKTREVHTRFWWRSRRERGLFEDLSVGREIILEWNFKKWEGLPGLY